MPGPRAGPAPREAVDPKYEEGTREDLPIFPDFWHVILLPGGEGTCRKFQSRPHREETAEMLNARGADREGELLFRRIALGAGCGKHRSTDGEGPETGDVLLPL